MNNKIDEIETLDAQEDGGLIIPMVRAFLWAVVFGLVLLIVGIKPARAWEFPRNPDRFPSVGFNISSADLGGERDEVSTPSTVLTNAQGGPVDFSGNTAGMDVRLPVNDGMTLSISADHYDNRTDFKRNGGTYRESESLRGFKYGLGVRVYFNR